MYREPFLLFDADEDEAIETLVIIPKRRVAFDLAISRDLPINLAIARDLTFKLEA